MSSRAGLSATPMVCSAVPDAVSHIRTVLSADAVAIRRLRTRTRAAPVTRIRAAPRHEHAGPPAARRLPASRLVAHAARSQQRALIPPRALPEARARARIARCMRDPVERIAFRGQDRKERNRGISGRNSKNATCVTYPKPKNKHRRFPCAQPALLRIKRGSPQTGSDWSANARCSQRLRRLQKKSREKRGMNHGWSPFLSPVAASHSRTFMSDPTVQKTEPSGLKRAQFANLVCSRIDLTNLKGGPS